MKSIALIGAANLDILSRPVSPDVFEKGTWPARENRMHTGGDALNEASVLGLLQQNVRLITVLGQDPAGDLIRRHCQDHHITLEEAVHHEPTSINQVLVLPDGERCFINCPSTSMRMLRKTDIPPLAEDIVCLASLFVSHALSLSDYEELFSLWKQQNRITAMDTTTAKHGETLRDLAGILRNVDILFTNLRESRSYVHAQDPEEILRALARAGSRTVLLKMGKEGAMVLHEGEIFAAPAVPAGICVDTTGCGDSFAAGFLAGLAQDLPFSACLQAALTCGSIACRKTGSTAAFEDPSLLQQAQAALKRSGR